MTSSIAGVLRLLALSLLLGVAAVQAAPKPIPGPNGGRIVTDAPPHVEFLVQADRSVRVSFLDKELRPLAVEGRVVSLVAETKGGREKLAFVERDGVLVSNAPLPEGDGFRVVLQVSPSAGAKPRNYRIDYHAELCGGCKRAEYACVCADAGDHAAHGH